VKSWPPHACRAFSFVCIEGATEMPEREDDHEALAAGLDIDIGRRIKLRRIQLGLSQSDLARKIGPVAFQQVQKYENGTDRVSASRLYLITWRRHRVFPRASTTPLPASTPAVAGSIDCLGERYAIEVLECFRDMTPEQRSTCARREAPGALLGAVLADCSAASGLFDDPVGQKPAIR
jgi:DNA-binding XRE family transcriptional regulator